MSAYAEALETELINLDMHQGEYSRVAAPDLEDSGGQFSGHELRK